MHVHIIRCFVCYLVQVMLRQLGRYSVGYIKTNNVQRPRNVKILERQKIKPYDDHRKENYLIKTIQYIIVLKSDVVFRTIKYWRLCSLLKYKYATLFMSIFCVLQIKPQQYGNSQQRLMTFSFKNASKLVLI